MLFREKNIENIELLVHPLYDALYGVVWNIFDISKEEFLEVLKKVKKEDVGKYLFKNYKIREKRKKQIKVTLGVYGKKITTINPENSLLCVIKPNFEYSPISKHINYLEYTYNHFLNRLISFSEKKK